MIKKEESLRMLLLSIRLPVFSTAISFTDGSPEKLLRHNPGICCIAFDTTIDEQYCQLVQIGNKLIFLPSSGAAPQQISRQVHQPLEHVANHFSSEEQIIGKLVFSGFTDYQEIHQSLLNRVGQMVTEHLSKKGKTPIFLPYIIIVLMIGHRLQDDNCFLPDFQNHSN